MVFTPEGDLLINNSLSTRTANLEERSHQGFQFCSTLSLVDLKLVSHLLLVVFGGVLDVVFQLLLLLFFHVLIDLVQLLIVFVLQLPGWIFCFREREWLDLQLFFCFPNLVGFVFRSPFVFLALFAFSFPVLRTPGRNAV